MSSENQQDSFLKICKICDKNESKYCCPRCNILYCSLDCYKSSAHIQCSESFYKDCINQEMGAIDPDPNSKKKMMEILSKMYKSDNAETDPENLIEMLTESGNEIPEQFNETLSEDMYDYGITEEDFKDSDDEDSVPDLADRLKDIDLDDPDVVWDTLTDNEKKEFECLLESRDITKILPVFKPWWLYYKEKKLVEEIDNSKLVKNVFDYEKECPKLVTNVKDFSTISKTQPAACVKWNLVNVLASYVCIVRMFNGDHNSFTKEVFTCLACICDNFKSGANFEDFETAVESVVQECHNNPSIISDAGTKETIIHDLQCILRGPEESNRSFYVKSSLSDLQRIFNEMKKYYKDGNTTASASSKTSKGEFTKRYADHQMFDLPKITKDKYKMMTKKLEYYLSYVKDHSKDIFM